MSAAVQPIVISHYPPSTSQGGMALIAALFMIIVVAALGAFAVRIGANQQQTANLELLSYRALAAAHSGLEFGSNQLSRGVDICNPIVAPPPISLAVGDFTVTVSCPPATNHSINAVNYQIYELTAKAVQGTYGNPDFVQRTMTRRVSNIPPGAW